jgi:AcrR family transcriptional regulator
MATRLPAEERKAAVLDTACGIFSTGSYRGTTTAEIARRAGVTEPVLYRHFASKRDLYLAVLDESWSRLRAVWQEAVDGEPDPRFWVAAMGRAYFAIEDPKLRCAELWMQALTEASDDAEIRNPPGPRSKRRGMDLRLDRIARNRRPPSRQRSGRRLRGNHRQPKEVDDGCLGKGKPPAAAPEVPLAARNPPGAPWRATARRLLALRPSQRLRAFRRHIVARPLLKAAGVSAAMQGGLTIEPLFREVK